MKKVLAFAVVAAALSFTACGGKKTENTESADTSAMVAPAGDTSAMAPADTAMTADTSAMSADTAKAAAPAAH